MKLRMSLATCLLLAVGLTSPDACLAQVAQNTFGEPQLPPEPPRPVKRLRVIGGPWERRIEAAGRPDSMHAIHEAAARVRDAEGQEERADAEKILARLLDEYFEKDMQRRADELAKIEERVKKLHALLEKRAAKKQEIIDLQMKVLENEADGLGFFNNEVPGSGGTLIFAPKASTFEIEADPPSALTPRGHFGERVSPPAGAVPGPVAVPDAATPAPATEAAAPASDAAPAATPRR